MRGVGLFVGQVVMSAVGERAFSGEISGAEAVYEKVWLVQTAGPSTAAAKYAASAQDDNSESDIPLCN